MFVPQHAGRCLKPREDRGPQLRDKCPILALDPLATVDYLRWDGIGIDEPAIARVTGGRHVRPPVWAGGFWRCDVVEFVAHIALHTTRLQNCGGTSRRPNQLRLNIPTSGANSPDPAQDSQASR
jgi:hypothetical protein